MESKIEAIRAVCEKENIFIASHLYQPYELSAASDITGDTMEIIKKSVGCSAQTIIVCAVRFIAEMIKILAPEKKVILAHPEATCPMANQILPSRIRRYRKENENACVVAYVNTAAAVKAECDVCVSTESAESVCAGIDKEKILFIPDRNLGEHVGEKTGKNIETWNCYCPIHDSVTLRDIELAKTLWPNAKTAAHLGCRSEVVNAVDFSGSAGRLMEWCAGCDEVIIAAESSIADRLTKMYPNRIFHCLTPEKLTCNHMKRTSVDTLLRVLNDGYGEIIEIDDATAKKVREASRGLFAETV